MSAPAPHPWLTRTPAQRDAEARARAFAEGPLSEASPLLETGDLGTQRRIWRALADAGLVGLAFPTALGGQGLDSVGYVELLRSLARVSASVATTLSVHTSVGMLPLLTAGTPEQQARYLPRMATGEVLAAFALTEPGAGSDAASGLCRATPQGDGYRLDGTKIFISNALQAGLFLVTARTGPPESGAKGLTAFLVEPGSPGFHIQPGEPKLGLRGSDWGELVFDGCHVPASQRLGAEGDGFRLFMRGLDTGRVGIAAIGLGVADAVLEALTRRAQSLRDIPDAILADLATRLTAATQLVHTAARLKDAGQPFGTEASMAKWFASHVALEATQAAARLFGLAGYAEAHDPPVARWLRDARVLTLVEGTSEIQQTLIARAALST